VVSTRDTDDALRREIGVIAAGVFQRGTHRHLCSLQVVCRVLAGEVGVGAVQQDARIAVWIIEDVRARLISIVYPHHEGAYRVGTVVQPNHISGLHRVRRLTVFAYERGFDAYGRGSFAANRQL
jgi:hypothetical protein